MMIAILAGHTQQYHQYLRTHGLTPKDAVNCDSIGRMRGLRFKEFIRIGTWYSLPDDIVREFDYTEQLHKNLYSAPST